MPPSTLIKKRRRQKKNSIHRQK